jgi:hypothetical protein
VSPRTSTTAIIGDQRDLIATIADRFDDFDPASGCWGCGEERKLFRAHIVPASAGGPDTGANYFLLCRTCHREQPDNASEEAQKRWLLDREPRGFRALHWLLENVCKPLLVRAEQLAPTKGEALLGAWMSELGETDEQRQIAFSKIADGKFGYAGALAFEGRLNTAKYELFVAFEAWVATRSQHTLVASLVTRGDTSPTPR